MEKKLAMECPNESGFMPDCDCPYEHWHVGGLCLDIHFEENGEVQLVCMGEDWDAETTLAGLPSIEEARPMALAWLDRIVTA